MPRSSLFLNVELVVLASLLFYGCSVSSHGDINTFAVERVLDSSRNVVVAPLTVPPDLKIPDDVLAACDSVIHSKILGVGFSAIPSTQYADAWDRIVVVMDGLYDTTTGEWDQDRYEIAREQLVRDLSDRNDFRLIVRPEIWFVDAPFSGGTARWDGTSQGMVGFGTRLLDFFVQIFNASESSFPEGTVPAISLGIIIENLDGDE